MHKSTMIEGMLERGAISPERAEELLQLHVDEVEAEWMRSFETEGAFEGEY